MQRKVIFWAGVIALAAMGANGQQVQQQLSITNGWNMLYVAVAPTVDADTLFANWPVQSVSLYRASQVLETSQLESGLTSEAEVVNPFLIWTREAAGGSTLARVMADSVLVCYATNALEVGLWGVPAAPRIRWHKTDVTQGTYNYIGVRLASPAGVGVKDYLGGSGIGGIASLRMTGSEHAPATANQATFTSGKALLVKSDSLSNWSGPLYVSPQNGVSFGTNGTITEVTIRNDSVTNRVVTLKHELTNDLYPLRALMYNDGDAFIAAWTNLASGASISKSLATGEVWKVELGLDRTKLANTGHTLGGVFTITDDSNLGTYVQVPVTATDQAEAGKVWPYGLWVAELALNQVSRYTDDSTRVDHLAAGGTMKVRLILWFDAAGTATLLQRVIVGGVATSGGTTASLNAYAGNVTLPAGLSVTARLSSGALPVDVPIIAATNSAKLFEGGEVVFDYTIAASSPSNPFRHHLHPFFDGLQTDFKTAAPSGDNIKNYVGSVKPELFSIGGEIKLTAADSSYVNWTPQETVAGTCRWTYTGVRRQGPVHADGTFTMKRVFKDGSLFR